MFDKRKDSNQDSSGAGYAASDQNRPASSTVATAAMGKSALIGAGIKINGDIAGSENLVIEGKVEGTIDLADNQVLIGQSGTVNADVTANSIKIDGQLHGNVDGKEKVMITKSGNVQGNITAPRVMLEDGAIFKGSIDINPVESAVAELPLPANKPASSPKMGDAAGKESGFTAK